MMAILLFVVAGLAEIGGGYLVWLWLRESRPLWYGLTGAVILIAYGIIPTLQKFPSFGRVYAAYGGVFVVLAVLWGWLVDKKHRICTTGLALPSASLEYPSSSGLQEAS